ncbi:SusC/RagA family TonB-linked outer membrane protein [Flammeovirga yaeyamensis]|uniref:SusC/RagA family TonB-linked outer membrane protein n=1 Tax=Flammeovirga yaeyamensis TaxID=367791 RepID=A0AAX1MZI5_9BACT|nr:SusC/RagA family TonB-linked outer membrane protein [Flammeovirga yaeyamensis]MBB3695987.1 TonB-linked SusC/RagA family outer membrane protein [Flammeovirga yaeyamensis]NMF34673.1 SusC/RagA family TonB-linked outer membrane protein [Flammeovirga yaeyamensis]QWG00497.1 SusC/RagA family TonB-linked outer membrane protein [Flammeovirga yaeyamensis]
MNRIFLMLTSIILFSAGASYAQERNIKGTVTDASDNAPLPGVNILIKGTTQGAVTDFDGNFEVQVEEGQDVLVFSFIGYETTEFNIANSSEVKISLAPDAEELDEVVVTALGIKRDERSLGYAVSEVKSDDLGENSSANLMNSLNGKVAGVQITPVSGPASSSNVTIRGNAVLSGSNQPLYVVDGVPMSNSNFENADDMDNGGIDTGDGLSSINPDDIESMSVLKGPAATALYGTRAINGVILITTKSGEKRKGLGIDFSTGVNFDVVGITPTMQNQYAHGTQGAFPNDMDASEATRMWGPKVTPGMTTNTYFDGKERTVQHYNIYDELYKTGVTFNNSISLTGGNETSNVRFSYSNMNNSGNVENSTFNRHTFNFRGSTKLMNEKLTLDSRVTYTHQEANNRMAMGNSVYNYQNALMGIPNTTSMDWLRNYKGADGRPIGYDAINNNPYWTMYEVNNRDQQDRMLGMFSLNYEFNENLNLVARGGTDVTTFRQNVLDPLYTPRYEQGRAFERTNLNAENNFDFLLQYNKKFGDFDISATGGGSYMYQVMDATDIGSLNFVSEDQQHPGAGTDRFIALNRYERAIASVYATASIGYKGYLFLDVSGRNDWSSTLPIGNNSYFYPSVSTSWVFSDMDWNTPEWLSFGKLRASWAQVGSDTDPYSLHLQYNVNGMQGGRPGFGYSMGGIEGQMIPNQNLRPSMSSSYEFGLDLRLFNNKVGLDLAYYNQTATDQILPVDVSSASGFNQALINAGEIQNRGVELMINYSPIQTDNFSWDMMFTAAYNQNEVVSLTEGVESYLLMPTSGSVSVQAIPGQAYGVIMGTTYVRDDVGNIVVTENGLPVVSDEVSEIGNSIQPWMAGWRNTFNYKNFSLSVLIDGKFGGQIYSQTNASMYANGKHEDTIEGRHDFYYGNGWNPGNLVLENGEAFTGSVDPELYYRQVALINEQFVYDASFIKLREVSVSYRLPANTLEKTPFRNLSVTAYGNNLGYLWRNTPNIDPEASFTSGNGQGIEWFNMPLPRTFGFKLNANF